MSARLGLRRRLQLSVVGSVTLVLVALIVAFNVVLSGRLSHEADNALAARTAGTLASLRVTTGRLQVPELPDAGGLDAQTWVFSGSRVLEQPPSDPVAARAARRLSGGPRRTIEVGPTPVRLYVVPVLAAGRRWGTVVAEVSMAPYRNTQHTALIASLLLGLAVLVMVAIASRMLISGALTQVSAMTERAAAWSESDTGRRFGLGPARDEFTRLAATLDGLLDRVATSLRHEQRFSAELSHELRTPLSNVILEAQLGLRHPRTDDEYRAGYQRVLDSAGQIARTLETLVAVARLDVQRPRGSGDAARAAQAAAEACSGLAAERGIALDVQDPRSPIRIGVETDVAERVLAPLVENGCRYGASAVTVTVERHDGAVLFRIRDDGPGVAGEQRDQIFEPGWRGERDRPGPAAVNGAGAGLGLALARRLARAAGGEVAVEEGGGGRFIARLPAG